MKMKISERSLKEENSKVVQKEEKPKERREDSAHIGNDINHVQIFSIVSIRDGRPFNPQLCV
jgi:hypothetical protein